MCVSRKKVLQALNEMKTGKAPGLSEVSLVLTAANKGTGIQVMAEICLRVLDGFGMPYESTLNIPVPFFLRIGAIWKSCCYGSVKLLEHGIKVVERVFEKRLCRIVSVDKMQFSFVPGRGTIDAVFILRRMQEKYNAKIKKLYMCFVFLERAFDKASVGMGNE